MWLPPADLCLKGQRVLLRPLEAADAPALALAAGEDRAHYGYTQVPGDNAAAYVAQAEAQCRAGARFPFAIEFNGRLVGSTSYAGFQPWNWAATAAPARQRHAAPDAVEIGYTWLAASAQRSPCNTEAKYLLLRHAFEAWQVHRVYLKTDARNARSRAAIERLGARLDGVLRADMPASDGSLRDSAWYSILLPEWGGVKAALEARLSPSNLPGESAHG